MFPIVNKREGRKRGIHNIGKAIRIILIDLEGTPEISFSGISPKILTFEYYAKIKLVQNHISII